MIKGIWASYGYHIYCFIQLFLVTWGFRQCEENDIIILKTRRIFWWIWIFSNVPVIIQLYALFPIFNIIQKYISGGPMLTIIIHILMLIYSTYISDIYDLMWRILSQISISPYCNVTVPLVQHWVITNFRYMVFHICMQHYYWALLYLRLFSYGQLFYFLLIWSLSICVYFCWRINDQYSLCCFVIITSQKNNYWPIL